MAHGQHFIAHGQHLFAHGQRFLALDRESCAWWRRPSLGKASRLAGRRAALSGCPYGTASAMETNLIRRRAGNTAPEMVPVSRSVQERPCPMQMRPRGFLYYRLPHSRTPGPAQPGGISSCGNGYRPVDREVPSAHTGGCASGRHAPARNQVAI